MGGGNGSEEGAHLRVALTHHLGKVPFRTEGNPSFSSAFFLSGYRGRRGLEPRRVSIERLMREAAEARGPHAGAGGIVPYLLEP